MAKIGNYISGVSKLVNEKQKQKAPKAARDTGEYEKLDKDHGHS